MSLPLSGKVALVTGSSRSIGAAIVKRLAADGASVVVNYVTTKDAAQKLVEEINAEGRGKAVAIQADMSSVAGGSRLVEETVQHFGRLDILVLNAAYMVLQPLQDVNETEYDSHFMINVKVPLFMTQTAAKYLTSGGRVVFLSSVVTKNSSVGSGGLVYAATKGAVEQLTRVLAKDLGPRGVTVNCVAPGATDTVLFRKSFSQEMIDQVASTYLQKRIAQPDEIAPIVAFLSREEAGWVNGQTIFVSNGNVV